MLVPAEKASEDRHRDGSVDVSGMVPTPEAGQSNRRAANGVLELDKAGLHVI